MKIQAGIKHFISELFKPVFNSYNQKRTLLIKLLSFLSFIIIVFFILNAVMNQAEERTRTNTINTLKTVLNASNATIKDIWAKGHFNDVNLWASDPDLVRNTKELLKMPQDSSSTVAI